MREQVFQLNESLHFGSIITLRYTQGSSLKYMCSDGISIRNLITLSSLDSMIDISTCLFTILPPIKFQFEKQMQKVLKEKYGQNGDEQFGEKNTMGVIDEFEFEVSENNDIIEKMKRTPLKYGQSFMLQHIHSCKYLSFSRLSENSSEYFLELTEIPGHNSYFIFEACYNYQDEISLYIAFDSQLYLTMRIENQIEVREAALNFKRGSILEEWEVSFEKKVPLQVGLFQTAEQSQPEYMHYGEALWIFHLQTSSFLKLLNTVDAPESFFFKKIKIGLNLEGSGADDEESNDRIFLERTKNELSAQKLGLWKIEAANRFQGGRIKFDHEVRLLNIRYKVYLSVHKTTVKKKTVYKIATEKFHSDNTLFRMKPLSANSIYVTSSDLIIFEHILSNTYLGVDLVDTQQGRFEISPNLKYKNQDNFKFTKASFMQNWENNFVISVLPFIEEGSSMLAKARTRPLRKKEQSFLMFLRETLIELMNFSQDISECFEISDNKLGKVSFNHFLIQKILRQQGFLQLITRLLDLIDPQLFKKRKTQYEQKFRMSGLSQILYNFLSETKFNEKQIELDLFLMESIVRIALKFLRNATKYNLQSSIILFDNLNVCIKFLGLSIGAQDFFQHFFRNNPRLLAKQNIPFVQIRAQYTSLRRTDTDYFPEMFDILDALLRDDNEGNTKNQIALFELLVVQKSSLLLPIFNMQDRLFIYYQGRSHQLIDFSHVFSVNPRMIIMVIRQIQFFSQLVYGRNYVCSKHFKSIFTFPSIMTYLASDLNNNIKASLVSLLHTAYIDERPRFIQHFPNLTYSFRQVQVSTGMAHNPSMDHKEKQQIKQKRKYDQVIELTRSKSMNLQEGVIRELLETVSLRDSLSHGQLGQAKQWVVEAIEKFIGAPNMDEFYQHLNYVCLLCLKKMIELTVFTARENEDIQRLIISIIKKLKQSMGHVEDPQEFLSDDFNQILREMLAKNILKKFNNRSKFDGLEDEITMNNISLRFVKYAYYQNLFLFKRPNLNKDNVIDTVLLLISNASSIRIDDSMRTLIQTLKQTSLANLQLDQAHSQQLVSTFIRDSILAQLKHTDHQQMLQSLILLFYDSNKYDINQKAMMQMLELIFENKRYVDCLSKVIIIADDTTHSAFEKMRNNFFNVKLMVETSEIWFTPNYQDPRYIYAPVVHHMIDKLSTMMNLMIDGSHVKLDDILLMSRYEKAFQQYGVSVERQMIIMNFQYAEEVINFLGLNQVILNKLTVRTEKNKAVVDLFKVCFDFLNLYILNCRETKKSLRPHITFLLQLVNTCHMQLGQTHVLIQYLKDNYMQSLSFIQSHLQSFISKIIKDHRYSFLAVKLIKTVSQYYNQPITASLKKLFFWLFDVNSFRKFMYMIEHTGANSAGGRYIFQLDRNLLLQPNQQPFFYQMEAIDAMLYVRDHLEESRNTIRNNIKSSLNVDYLFHLLAQRDYFSDQNSADPELKLFLLFKGKVLDLIEKVYLYEDQEPEFYQRLQQYLLGQSSLFEIFLEEFNVRKQTIMFRKVVIGLGNRRKDDPLTKIIENKLSLFIETNHNYFKGWKKKINKFCTAVEKASDTIKQLEGCGGISKNIITMIEKLNRLLHQSDFEEAKDLEIPFKWLMKPLEGEGEDQIVKTKKFVRACILEALVSRDVQDSVKKLESQLMEKLEPVLKRLSINMFNFFRKIAEFIEDTLQKLTENQNDVLRLKLVKNLLRFLKMSLQIGGKEKRQEIRMLMGKCEVIFPFLNYLEITKLTKPNSKILKLFIELLCQLLSEEGNKTIQKILYQYFSNKPESFELFFKIKQVIVAAQFERQANFKSQKLSSAVKQLKKDARRQDPNNYSMLQFLILLCKGNNRKNQLFLAGLNRVSSFDVIKIVLTLLRDQTNELDGVPLINMKNYRLIIQCFNTIRALVEGPCNQNQDLFVSSSFFEVALKYFRFELQTDKEVGQGVNITKQILMKIDDIGITSQPLASGILSILRKEYEVQAWMVSQIKFRCISTVLSLLEENISDSAINKLVMSIPAHEIVHNINKVYARYKELELNYQQKNLDLNEDQQLVLPLGFKLYFVLQYHAQKDIQIPKKQQALDFFSNHTKTIQVVHSKLFTLRFPQPPFQISDAFKKQFLQKTDRTSINSKLKDLQQTQIQNRSTDYGIWLYFLVLLINILDMIIYNEPQATYVENFRFYFRPYGYGGNIVAEMMEVAMHFIAITLSFLLLVFQWYGAMYMKQKLKELATSPQTTRWKKIKDITVLMYNNLSYGYYLLTTLLLLFGLMNPFLDTLVLVVQLFKRNQTFSQIGKAIKQSLGQLLVVLLIYFIANYILLIFVYFHYNSSYSSCDTTLYRCLSFGLDIALKADSGVVGYNDNPDTILQDFLNDTFFDVFFDFLYLFIIKIIVEQVLGAIIVDKFAQIREDTEKRNTDEETKCYICGMDVELFDREEDGFETHKEQYHNIWNYFYFLIYLSNSEVKNLSGIQLFVHNCKEQGELRWFPINRSLHLENKRKLSEIVAVEAEGVQEDNDQKIIDNELGYLKKSMDQINELVNYKLFQKEMRQ